MNYRKSIPLISLLKSFSENNRLTDLESAYDEFLIEIEKFIENEFDLNIVYLHLSYAQIELTGLHYYLDDVTEKKSIVLSN